MTGSGCQLNKSAAAQSQSKFILPSLIPRNELNDEHPNVVPRLLEMDVKRETIEQLRAATMPI